MVIGDRVTVAVTPVSEAPDPEVDERRSAGREAAGSAPDGGSERRAWTIESVAERSSELVRRGRGGRVPKVLAANLDRVFVVVAVREPPASTELVDRLLVLVESSGMYPVLVLNKVDLEGAREAAGALSELYRSLGYETLAVSARSGEGLDALADAVCRGSSALIGPSGVGKSSLLNALDPTLHLRTGELSGKGRGGRHTTVSSRMIALECGGYVADTPGFSDVALWGVEPDDVAACFTEFEDRAEPCRFRMCAHQQEPDCGVRDAVDAGRIPRSRYESYLKLRAEAAEANAR